MTFKPGDTGHLAEHDRISGELAGRLSDASLSATYVQQVTSVESESVTAATARLNTALSTGSAFGVRRTVRLVGDFVINAPLVIGSNTTLDATDAYIALESGAGGRMLQTTQTPDFATTGSITADSTTLTTTDPVPDQYVGQTIVIAGAGGTGPTRGNGVGLGTSGIASIHARIVDINGTTVTISVPARVTVTDQSVGVFVRNRNVHVRGGTWERLENNTGTVKSVTLERVDGFSIRDLEVITHDGKYAVYVGDFSDGSIRDLNLSVVSDGVSISGPGYGLTIEGIRGATGDDGVSLLPASEYAGDQLGAEPWGDLTDIVVRDVRTLGNSGVAVVASELATLDRITIDNIHCDGINPVVAVGNWVDAVNKQIGQVSIRNVSGNVGASTNAVVAVRSSEEEPNVRQLTVENVQYTGADLTKNCLSITGVVHQLSVKSLLGTRAMQVMTPTSQVMSGVVEDVVASGTDAIVTSGKVQLSLRAVRHTGASGYVIDMVNSGANGSVIDVDSSCQSTGLLASIVSGITATFTGSFGPGATTTVFAPPGSTAIVLAASRTGSFGSAGVAFQPYNPQFRVHLDRCAKLAGLMAWNTNTGLSCGSGPVICDGVSWKHMFTGATYTP